MGKGKSFQQMRLKHLCTFMEENNLDRSPKVLLQLPGLAGCQQSTTLFPLSSPLPAADGQDAADRGVTDRMRALAPGLVPPPHAPRPQDSRAPTDVGEALGHREAGAGDPPA